MSARKVELYWPGKWTTVIVCDWCGAVGYFVPEPESESRRFAYGLHFCSALCRASGKPQLRRLMERRRAA